MEQRHNDVEQRRWQGPYVQQNGGTYAVNDTNGFTLLYGNDTASSSSVTDPTVMDAWGRPIVIQVPTTGVGSEPGVNFVRLVSAGPDGVINTPENVAMPTTTERGDDIILFLFHEIPTDRACQSWGDSEGGG